MQEGIARGTILIDTSSETVGQVNGLSVLQTNGFSFGNPNRITGQEGVMVPASNVKHLMLRADVVDAAREGLFHIYPVETIDEGVEVLTGCAAGDRDKTGVFPEGTVNRKVEDRLMMFAEESMAYRDGPDDDQPGGSHTAHEDEEEDDGGGADEA